MLTYNRHEDTHICSVHGDVGDNTGWITCPSCGGEGFEDLYEEDPLWYDEGEIGTCGECGGEGGWVVCGECNRDNPDVEW